MIEIVRVGPGATVQDLGRPGRAAWGIGRSGAADRGALRLGNRLVGNHETAAGIEFTFGGATVRATQPVLVAVTGAPVALATTAPRAGFGIGFVLAAGAELELGRPETGVRTYLTVRGGVAVPLVLGARATDTLAGIGPEPLRPGTRLPVGPVTGLPEPGADQAPLAPIVPSPLRVILGPRDDWTDPGALFTTSFTVRSDSDRIGVRLDGPPLARRPGELPPEGMVRGGIQLPPDGRPIVLHADHPVTGGYPVVAVVVDADLDHLGQLRPGTTVRFRPADRRLRSEP